VHPGEAAKGTASRSDSRRRAPLPGLGCTLPSPGCRLLCGCVCPASVKGDSESEGSLWPPNAPPSSLSFYSQVVLTHRSHTGPRTPLFSLGCSAWRPPPRQREGLGVTSLVHRDSFPSGPVPGRGRELGRQAKQSRSHAPSVDLEPARRKIKVPHSFVVLVKSD